MKYVVNPQKIIPEVEIIAALNKLRFQPTWVICLMLIYNSKG